MLSPLPYRFDRNFDLQCAAPAAAAAGEIDPDNIDPQPEPEPAKLYDADDLARARAEGCGDGRAAAVAEAAATVERQVAATLDRLAAVIAASSGDRDRLVADCERRAGQLAAAIVRRFVPAAIAGQGPMLVAEAVGRVLAPLRQPQRLTVRVAAAEREAIAGHLQTLANTAALGPATLAIVADPAIEPGDCRIDWEGGHAVRDGAALWQEIEAVLGRSFGAAAPAPADPDGGAGAVPPHPANPASPPPAAAAG